MTSPLRILLVGAGSVGQVYGHHFQRGGAEVRFLVRPKYVAEGQQGYTLHRLGRRGAETLTFHPDQVCGAAAEAVRGGVDAVVLCMSYAGLKGGWFEELLGEAGDATIVSLVPGAGARCWLEDRVEPERLAHGMITLLAYPAPMRGEALDAGTAFWFPPMSPCPFDGPRSRTEPLVQCLVRGGQPAKWRGDGAQPSDLATCMLMPLLAALELEGWSFASLSQSPRLREACAAGRDALDVAFAGRGGPPSTAKWAMRPLVVRGVIRTARAMAPVDLEAFLQLHFTKVGAQTRLILAEWIEQGETVGVDTGRLRTLYDGLMAIHGEE